MHVSFKKNKRNGAKKLNQINKLHLTTKDEINNTYKIKYIQYTIMIDITKAVFT